MNKKINLNTPIGVRDYDSSDMKIRYFMLEIIH